MRDNPAATDPISTSSSLQLQEAAPQLEPPPANELEEELEGLEVLRVWAMEGSQAEFTNSSHRQAGAELGTLARELNALRESLKGAPTAQDEEAKRRANLELRQRLAERIKAIAAGLKQDRAGDTAPAHG